MATYPSEICPFPSALYLQGNVGRNMTYAQSHPVSVARLEWLGKDLAGTRSGGVITAVASSHRRMRRDHLDEVPGGFPGRCDHFCLET